MSHETLQALYALDLAEVGEKEAAKRWEFWRGDAWVECFQTIKWNSVVLYRRKPGIPCKLGLTKNNQNRSGLLTLQSGRTTWRLMKLAVPFFTVISRVLGKRIGTQYALSK